MNNMCNRLDYWVQNYCIFMNECTKKGDFRRNRPLF